MRLRRRALLVSWCVIQEVQRTNRCPLQATRRIAHYFGGPKAEHEVS